MKISVCGADRDGRKRSLDWELTADDNHGAEIPCMAVILMARKLVAGSVTRRGAMPCVGLLTLRDFETEFSRWHITTRIDETAMNT